MIWKCRNAHCKKEIRFFKGPVPQGRQTSFAVHADSDIPSHWVTMGQALSDRRKRELRVELEMECQADFVKHGINKEAETVEGDRKRSQESEIDGED